jgi:hypothetical protein
MWSRLTRLLLGNACNSNGNRYGNGRRGVRGERRNHREKQLGERHCCDSAVPPNSIRLIRVLREIRGRRCCCRYDFSGNETSVPVRADS